MRIPIQYALTWPDRMPSPVPELDFTALTKLSIAQADEETFRCLAACKKAIRKGGLAPCAANGANEAAVAHFLRNEIGFWISAVWSRASSTVILSAAIIRLPMFTNVTAWHAPMWKHISDFVRWI